MSERSIIENVIGLCNYTYQFQPDMGEGGGSVIFLSELDNIQIHRHFSIQITVPNTKCLSNVYDRFTKSIIIMSYNICLKNVAFLRCLTRHI